MEKHLPKDSKLNELISSLPFADEIFKHAFLNANSGITITDYDGNILDVNPGFTQITGYTREEAIGNNPNVLRSFYQNDAFYTKLWDEIKGPKGFFQSEIWNRRKSGDTYPELITIKRIEIPEKNEKYFVAVFSKLKQLDEKGQTLDLAFHDPLTKIANKRLLKEHLKKIKQNVDRATSGTQQSHFANKQITLFFFDLNKFKEVNDTLGHLAGDKLLQIVVERLNTIIRDTDILARVGGDEFILASLLGDTKKEAKEICKRVMEILSKPFDLDGKKAEISTSIGVALYPSDAKTTDELIEKADKAMYEAKENKKGFLFYDELK